MTLLLLLLPAGVLLLLCFWIGHCGYKEKEQFRRAREEYQSNVQCLELRFTKQLEDIKEDLKQEREAHQSLQLKLRILAGEGQGKRDLQEAMEDISLKLRSTTQAATTSLLLPGPSRFGQGKW